MVLGRPSLSLKTRSTFIPACSLQLKQRLQLRSPADIIRHTLLIHDARADLWERWACSNGVGDIKPRQIIRLDSMTATVSAAQNGVGIALVSAPLVEPRLDAGDLVKVTDTELATGEDYVLLARPPVRTSPFVHALMSWLTQEFCVSETEKNSI